MIKRILVVLSLVALMAGNFAVSPIAATPSSATYPFGPFILFSGTIYVSDGNQENGTFPCGTGEDVGDIVDYPVVPGKYYKNLPSTLSHVEVTITATPGNSSNNLPLIVLANGTQYVVTANDTPQSLNVYSVAGSVPTIDIRSAAQSAEYESVIEITLYFTVPFLDSTYAYHLYDLGLTIQDNCDGTATIFDGIFYLGSGAQIEIPLDMLSGFVSSYGNGWITSFNVSAPGLWIEVQGLYQQAYDYDFVSFLDWIGENPIPRGSREEEEDYNWYITLSGTAGWYDLQIYVEYF